MKGLTRKTSIALYNYYALSCDIANKSEINDNEFERIIAANGWVLGTSIHD